MLLLVVIFSANIIIMANESLNESVSQSAGFKMRKFAITINQTTTTIVHAKCLLFELPRERETLLKNFAGLQLISEPGLH